MKFTDHPEVHRLRGSISGGSGLEAAQKLVPPSEVTARGPGYSQPDPSYHQPKPTHQSSVLNMLDPDVDTEQYEPPKRSNTEPVSQYDDRYEELSQEEPERYSSDSDDGLVRQSRRRSRKFPHVGGRYLADGSQYPEPGVHPAAPRMGQKTRKGEPRSTSNPYKSDLMNRLDPRVDRSAVKRSRKSESH